MFGETVRAMSVEVDRSAELWSFAIEGEEPCSCAGHELLESLATGQLPPYTLVWKQGWGEWLPAMQVAEFAAAFPGAVGAPFVSARTAHGADRPRVPVSEYPRLKLLAKDVRQQSSPAPPRSGSSGFIEVESGVAVDFGCPESEVITSQVPIAALREAARVMTHPSPPSDLGLDEAIRQSERPPSPDAQTSIPPGVIPQLRSAAPLATELGLQGLIESGGPARPPRWIRPYGLWVGIAALALGVITLFAVRWGAAPTAPPARVTSRPSDGTSAAASSLPPAVAAAPAAVGSCRLSRDPVRLDEWAINEVVPSLALLAAGPNGARPIAVGYAQSHKQAVGLTLDVVTLQAERVFGDKQDRQIFSVDPLSAGEALEFAVERMGAPVACSRVMDTRPPLRIGMNEAGVVVGGLVERAEKVWGLPRGTVISVPAVAPYSGGVTVATLGGPKMGPVRVGIMSATGQPLSGLEQIGGDDARFGRPAVASGPEQTVVAVAALSTSGPSQSIWLARAPNGQPPIVLQPFDPGSAEPVGGGGAELDTPSIAALPDGGFALLYSQGRGWRRRVRLQRLSASLSPEGSPLSVSTPEPAYRGATVGALYWVGDRLLAFHFVSREEGHALHVASITCGEP